MNWDRSFYRASYVIKDMKHVGVRSAQPGPVGSQGLRHCRGTRPQSDAAPPAFLAELNPIFIRGGGQSLIDHDRWILTLSSLIVGALVPGMVAIVSSRLSELAPLGGHARLWGIATATFACAQGIAAAFFAWFYEAVEGGAELMFVIGGGALLSGALVVVLTSRLQVITSNNIVKQ